MNFWKHTLCERTVFQNIPMVLSNLNPKLSSSSLCMTFFYKTKLKYKIIYAR